MYPSSEIKFGSDFYSTWTELFTLQSLSPMRNSKFSSNCLQAVYQCGHFQDYVKKLYAKPANNCRVTVDRPRSRIDSPPSVVDSSIARSIRELNDAIDSAITSVLTSPLFNLTLDLLPSSVVHRARHTECLIHLAPLCAWRIAESQ